MVREEVLIMRLAMSVRGAMLGLALMATYALGITRADNNALLPEGLPAPMRRPIEEPRPLWPGCGMVLIGEGTCTLFDGYIDEEWANATVYDISDTCGQSDGLPNDPGSCYLYLMKDDEAIYLGIDAVVDINQDLYDGCSFYFEDNDDGCAPDSETNEGDITLKYSPGEIVRFWRWWQEDGNCAPDPDCGGYCERGEVGGFYYIDPRGWGISMTSGNMQYEIGINYGGMADEEWEVQTHFNLGETCGFYMYCINQNPYDYIGEFPCTGDFFTFSRPCLWPSLVGEKPDFTFSLEPFQTQVPIGGTLDFAKHFHNNTCQTMTIHDTLYVYKGGSPVKTFAFEWTFECEQDLDLCFALQVPEKDKFIGWDITIVNSGVAVAGGDEYPFSDAFDVHIEPGHESAVECP
jgi:hypothetical protein